MFVYIYKIKKKTTGVISSRISSKLIFGNCVRLWDLYISDWRVDGSTLNVRFVCLFVCFCKTAVSQLVGLLSPPKLMTSRGIQPRHVPYVLSALRMLYTYIPGTFLGMSYYISYFGDERLPITATINRRGGSRGFFCFVAPTAHGEKITFLVLIAAAPSLHQLQLHQLRLRQSRLHQLRLHQVQLWLHGLVAGACSPQLQARTQKGKGGGGMYPLIPSYLRTQSTLRVRTLPGI